MVSWDDNESSPLEDLGPSITIHFSRTDLEELRQDAWDWPMTIAFLGFLVFVFAVVWMVWG